jgi:hypothetical protein
MSKQNLSSSGVLLPILMFALEHGALAGEIPRRPVRSSTLVSVGYDAARKVLDLEFHSGEIYRYQRVPAATARALFEAQSKGRFFGARIRGKFAFTRLQPRENR